MDGKYIQFTFCIFPGAKTNEMTLNIDESIRKGQGEDGQQFTQKTYPHRDILMGMMNEIRISSQGPKGGNAQFLKDVERNAVYFGKFKPGYFMCTGPRSEETCTFEKYTDNPRGNWDELARQVMDVFRGQTLQIL